MNTLALKPASILSALTLAGSAVLMSAGEANAALLVTINNAGFEDPALADDGFTSTTPPDWNLYDPSGLISALPSSFVGVWRPPSSKYPTGAPEGENIGFILLTQSPGSGIVGLRQTLSSTLMANTQYTLKVEVGDTLADADFPDLGGFPGYQIELLAGGNVLALDDNSLNITEGTFETSTISFTVPDNHPNLGDPLEIRLLNILESDGQEVTFDNVRLEASPVPEPSAILGLLAVSSIGALVGRKKG